MLNIFTTAKNLPWTLRTGTVCAFALRVTIKRSQIVHCLRYSSTFAVGTMIIMLVGTFRPIIRWKRHQFSCGTPKF